MSKPNWEPWVKPGFFDGFIAGWSACLICFNVVLVLFGLTIVKQ